MIDTIRAGWRFELEHQSAFYQKYVEILENLKSHGRYEVKKYRRNFDDCVRKKRAYQSVVHIKDKESRKYLFVQYEKMKMYKNIFDIKFNTELSRFSGLNDFYQFAFGVLKENTELKRFIKQACLSEIHLKIDFNDVDFDFFRTRGLYPYSRNSEIYQLLDDESAPRTFYWHKNLYAYEKVQREEKRQQVRLEKRILRAEILKKLGIEFFEDIGDLSVQNVEPIFNKMSFHQLSVHQDSFKDLPDYQRIGVAGVFELLENKYFKTKKTKNGLVRISFNSLQNAKNVFKEHFPGDFEVLERKVFKKSFFPWGNYINAELHELKGDNYDN